MRSILLVEDEKMIRYGIYVMIENSGVPYKKITECRNGKEAVECLKKENYDLVLTDIKMPIMGGLELAEWIENNMEKEKQPMIIAISGYAEFEYARGMMQHHALNYLLKPVDREELAKVLWNALFYFNSCISCNAADFIIAINRCCERIVKKGTFYFRINKFTWIAKCVCASICNFWNMAVSRLEQYYFYCSIIIGRW